VEERAIVGGSLWGLLVFVSRDGRVAWHWRFGTGWEALAGFRTM
jgi:hypothetical protein